MFVQLIGLSAGHCADTALVEDCCGDAGGPPDGNPATFGTPLTICTAPVNWRFCAAARRARLSAMSHMEDKVVLLRMLLLRAMADVMSFHRNVLLDELWRRLLGRPRERRYMTRAVLLWCFESTLSLGDVGVVRKRCMD